MQLAERPPASAGAPEPTAPRGTHPSATPTPPPPYPSYRHPALTATASVVVPTALRPNNHPGRGPMLRSPPSAARRPGCPAVTSQRRGPRRGRPRPCHHPGRPRQVARHVPHPPPPCSCRCASRGSAGVCPSGFVACGGRSGRGALGGREHPRRPPRPLNIGGRRGDPSVGSAGRTVPAHTPTGTALSPVGSRDRETPVRAQTGGEELTHPLCGGCCPGGSPP